MPATYLKCRNPVMTYMDPENHFKVPPGRVVPYEGRLTRTMQKWIRRGGLMVLDEAQYTQQVKADPTSGAAQQTSVVKEEPAQADTKEPPAETELPPSATDEKTVDTGTADPKLKKAKRKSGGSV